MNWFLNLKVGSKLLYSFMLIAVVSAINGYIGVRDIKSLDAADTVLYQNITVPISIIGRISTSFQRQRTNLIEAIIFIKDGDKKATALKKVSDRDAEIEKLIKEYETTFDGEEDKKVFADFTSANSNYKPFREIAVRTAEQTGVDAGIKYFLSELDVARVKVQDAIEKVDNYNIDIAKKTSEANTVLANKATNTMLAFVLGGILLALLFGYYISKLISRPIILLSGYAEKVAIGDVEFEVKQTTTDEIGNLMGSFKVMVEGIKAQVSYANKIAEGDLNLNVKVRSDKDILGLSFVKVIDTIKSLISEAGSLTIAAIDGKLSTRGNAAKFHGGYKEIVQGVNEILDAVIIPVKEGTEALATMASGDLTVRIRSDYKGDHQLIKNSINQLGESLTKVISDVTEAVQATASASSQISSSTEEMAAGSQEQSSQAAEVASAVEEMTTTILETSRNASNAAEAAKKAGTVAKEGGMIVRDTVAGMDRIAGVVFDAAETVKALGNSSDQIGEIIQVIDDIADQTNLLALNAAIEAARAGEQGRGFAVVADEVRKLAERTTKATKEIAAMIKTIQKDTTGAVESMARGTKEVEVGKTLANNAGKSLEQIITSATEVVGLISQVATASEQQSSAAEQIGRNIEGITAVSQESAAGTQQIARAAEDLNRLTENLQNLIGQFRIDASIGFGGRKSSSKFGSNHPGNFISSDSDHEREFAYKKKAKRS